MYSLCHNDSIYANSFDAAVVCVCVSVTTAVFRISYAEPLSMVQEQQQQQKICP